MTRFCSRRILLFCCTALMALTSYGDERPNVVFIVSDDLGVNPMAAAATPHLDRLARMSVSFKRAYCQYPVCAPSRNSFLTGQHSVVIGPDWAPMRQLAPDITALPQLFRENGYFTASIGKIFHVDMWDDRWPDEGWEYDDPKSWDFRINVPPANTGKSGNPPFPRKGIRYTWPGHGGAIDYGMMSFEDDLYLGDGQTTQEAIRELDRPKDKPFFLGLGYRRPHAPFIAPARYFWPYPLESIQLPDAGDRSDVPEVAYSVSPPNYGDAEAMKQMKMCYLASVSHLDAEVGRLLKYLEDREMMDNTIIIFFSDHGFQLGEHGEWHKNTLYEESAQVPLMIHLPGMTEGLSRGEVVELIDLYPTLQELCGLPAVEHTLNGQSLMPLLLGRADAWEAKPAFTQVRRERSNAMGYSVRTPRYRYTQWWSQDEEPILLGEELYDMQMDPASEHNLAGQHSLRDVQAELGKLMAQHRQQ